VGNAGGAATSATVSVVDTLPAGLTAASLAGNGWSCNLGTLTCTRSDALAVSANYPAITLTVNVSATAPASIINMVSASGGGETFTANDTANDPTTIIVSPTNFFATATSTSQASLAWDAVVGATSYQLFRSFNNGPFVMVGSPNTNNFTDAPLTANTTYVYFVRATDGSNTGPPSIRDLATTILFTDDPIVAGSTIIQAVHLTELRTAVNAVRAAAGLSAATFTDTLTAGVLIKVVHVNELRSNLDDARSALFLAVTPYTDPSLAAGDIVKAAHLQELRNGVK
jgi:hypothetical protein